MALALVLCACYQPSVDHSKVGKIKKIVILGNSIVYCPSTPAAGWYNSWGAAASSMDKDFVHLLIKDVHSKDTSVVFRFKNISDFERNCTTYDLLQLDSFKGADLYIFRLSENVTSKADIFINHYNLLINHLNTNNALTIIVDGFWPSPLNSKIEDFAKSKNYPFIKNSDLIGNPSNEAYNEYKNKPVASHPSDKGMKAIEQRIWDYLKNYY